MILPPPVLGKSACDKNGGLHCAIFGVRPYVLWEVEGKHGGCRISGVKPSAEQQYTENVVENMLATRLNKGRHYDMSECSFRMARQLECGCSRERLGGNNIQRRLRT